MGPSKTPKTPPDDTSTKTDQPGDNLGEIFTEISENDWFLTDPTAIVEAARNYRVASPIEGQKDSTPPTAPPRPEASIIELMQSRRDASPRPFAAPGPSIFTNVLSVDLASADDSLPPWEEAPAPAEQLAEDKRAAPPEPALPIRPKRPAELPSVSGWPSVDKWFGKGNPGQGSSEDESAPESSDEDSAEPRQDKKPRKRWRLHSQELNVAPSPARKDSYVPLEEEIEALRAAFQRKEPTPFDAPTNVLKRPPGRKPDLTANPLMEDEDLFQQDTNVLDRHKIDQVREAFQLRTMDLEALLSGDVEALPAPSIDLPLPPPLPPPPLPSRVSGDPSGIGPSGGGSDDVWSSQATTAQAQEDNTWKVELNLPDAVHPEPVIAISPPLGFDDAEEFTPLKPPSAPSLATARSPEEPLSEPPLALDEGARTTSHKPPAEPPLELDEDARTTSHKLPSGGAKFIEFFEDDTTHSNPESLNQPPSISYEEVSESDMELSVDGEILDPDVLYGEGPSPYAQEITRGLGTVGQYRRRVERVTTITEVIDNGNAPKYDPRGTLPADYFDPNADPFTVDPTIPFSISPRRLAAPEDDESGSPPGALTPFTHQRTELEKVTTFPLVPTGIDPHLLVLHDPEGEIANRYRQLDFKLKTIASERPARTVALTSPHPRSGTSLTLINLALIRAESPHVRIALVDLNFRNPELARLLGLAPTLGIPQVINGEASLEQIMLRMEGTLCYLLPSTPTDELPSRLYKHPALTRLFASLYDTFDLVLIDLPPVLPHADINQINALIDAIVLVVAARRTTGPEVARASKIIDKDKLVGVILNEGQS